MGSLLTGLGLLAILPLGALLAWVQWRRFTFHIEGGALRVEQGLLVRKSTRLSPERIQSVDTRANIVFRILGLVAVDIHTAGRGQTPEVSISALTESEATDLISRLRPVKPTVSREAVQQVEGDTEATLLVSEAITGPRWTLSTTELATVAATSTGGVLALAAIGPVVGAILPVVLGSSDFDIGGAGAALTWFIAIGAVALALVSWVAGSIATALQYWDFAVARSDGEVRVEKGLFQRNARAVPLGRVQAVRLVEGPLRQMIGRVTIAVDSAGLAAGAEFGPTVLHPLLTAPDARRFCDLMVPGHGLPRLQPVPARARIRYMVRLAALPAAIALPVAILVPYGSLAFLVPLVFAVWALLVHADAAWGLSREVLAVRWRGLARTTALVRRPRIQSVSVTQHPLQRLAGLASVSVSVAASPTAAVFSLRHIEQDDAWRLLEWVSDGARIGADEGVGTANQSLGDRSADYADDAPGNL